MKKLPMSGQSGAVRKNAPAKMGDGGQSGANRSYAKQKADRMAGKTKAGAEGPGTITSLEQLRAIAKGKMAKTVSNPMEAEMTRSKQTVEGLTPSGQPRKQVKPV